MSRPVKVEALFIAVICVQPRFGNCQAQALLGKQLPPPLNLSSWLLWEIHTGISEQHKLPESALDKLRAGPPEGGKEASCCELHQDEHGAMCGVSTKV